MSRGRGMEAKGSLGRAERAGALGQMCSGQVTWAVTTR